MQKQYKATLEELINIYRYLHQIPELSNQEYLTQKYILKYLEQFDFEVVTVNTGVMVYVDNNKKDIIAFRAEMDALPIEEKNDFEYKSKNNNMHACGHDGHMAILLMLCKYIYSNKNKLRYNYLLIFQPSEEKYGGSKLITDSLFFKLHVPKYTFALHLYPGLSEGKIFCRNGAFLAMCCEIDIAIKGKSTHIQNSEQGIDAIKIGNELINELYLYFDRLDKNKTKFLIGKINGGKARNIVSNNLSILITLRNFNKEDYLRQKKYISSLIDEYKNKTEIRLHFNDDFDPVINDKDLLNKVKNIHPIYETSRKIIGDDFAKYHLYSKTNYYLLGIKSNSFLHESTFAFNEKVLLKGLEFFIKLINL